MRQHSIAVALFDLDGLLINSEDLWHEAGKTFLRRRGLTFTSGFVQKIQGMTIRDVAPIWKQEFNLPDSAQTIEQELCTLGETMVYNNPRIALMPGVRAFLNWIAEQNVRRGIVTSIWKSAADRALRRCKIWGFMERVITLEDLHGKPSKPNPDIYLLATERFAVTPGQCLVFEDAPAGCESAQRAGMACIAVNSAFAQSDFPRVDYFARTFEDPNIAALCRALFQNGSSQ